MYFAVVALGLHVNALNLFFVAYSIPFAILVPVVHSMRSATPNPTAAFAALVAGFVISVVWGFGWALASSRGYAGTSFASADELLYLAPVVTVAIGAATFMAFRARPSTPTDGQRTAA